MRIKYAAVHQMNLRQYEDEPIVCPTCHAEMWPSETDHGYCPKCETDLRGVSDENRSEGI